MVQRSVPVVFLEGGPDYYSRLGFSGGAEQGCLTRTTAEWVRDGREPGAQVQLVLLRGVAAAMVLSGCSERSRWLSASGEPLCEAACLGLRRARRGGRV